MKCTLKNCERDATHTVNVIGYDIEVCFYHATTNPFRQFWANLQLKWYFWRYDNIFWSLWAEVFQMPKEIELIQ